MSNSNVIKCVKFDLCADPKEIHVWEIEENSVNEHLHAYHDDPANGLWNLSKRQEKQNEKLTIINEQRVSSTRGWTKNSSGKKRIEEEPIH